MEAECMYRAECLYRFDICNSNHSICPLYLEKLEQDKAKDLIIELTDRKGLVHLIKRRFGLKEMRDQ